MDFGNANNQVNNEMATALDSFEEVKIGDVVQGEVLAIEDNQLVIGIVNRGVEGVVPQREFTAQKEQALNELAKVGDIFDLVVISTIGKDKENGSFLLSKRRLEARQTWSELETKFKDNAVISGKVTQTVKGGVVVDVGVRGFIPASMLSTHFVKDMNQFVGQTLDLKIMEMEPSENRLILSHKEIMAQEQAEKSKAIFEKLLPGDEVTGPVVRLTNFGAFIDLGGVDGLVHVSEISHDHIKQPSDVLTIGQDITAKVLELDAEKGRIGLSIKATQPGPWQAAQEQISIGQTITGLVKRLTTFGAFIEVLPGVEGLVHISQISHQHIATPNELLKEGQEVTAKVLNMEADKQRLGLSIKALQDKPQANGATQTVEVTDYEMPETETGFSIGDMLNQD